MSGRLPYAVNRRRYLTRNLILRGNARLQRRPTYGASCGKFPRSEVVARSILSGFRIPAFLQFLFFHIPLKSLSAAISHVAQQADACGTMTDFNIADGTLTRLNAITEIAAVVEVGVIHPFHLHRR